MGRGDQQGDRSCNKVAPLHQGIRAQVRFTRDTRLRVWRRLHALWTCKARGLPVREPAEISTWHNASRPGLTRDCRGSPVTLWGGLGQPGLSRRFPCPSGGAGFVPCNKHPTGAQQCLIKRVQWLIPAPLKEGWPSGLRHTPGTRAYVKAYRGFESLLFRQYLFLVVFSRPAMAQKNAKIWRLLSHQPLDCQTALEPGIPFSLGQILRSSGLRNFSTEL
jgi:hypothetical protein